MAKIQAPRYDPQQVPARLGRAGHIALEVHSNGPGDPLGKDRTRGGLPLAQYLRQAATGVVKAFSAQLIILLAQAGPFLV